MSSRRDEQRVRAASVYSSVKEKASEIKQSEGHKRHGRVEDQLARDALFFDELDSRLANYKHLTLPALKQKKAENTKVVASLLLSDLHFGSMLGQEVAFPYGALEESRRMASVVEQTIAYFGDETDHLNLYILGDVIQNQLHDARDGAPLAAQVAAAIHYLTQTIQRLHATFPVINVYTSTGNHGRFTSRHKERAVHQKWDSLEQVVYYSLSKVFEKCKGITVHLNKQHYTCHSVLGHYVFATHGDTIMNVGSPNAVINVKGVESLINRIASNFQHKPKLFLCGHTHSPLYHVMNSGARLLMNGALVPPDEYAATMGWLTSTSGQWGWLTSETKPCYNTQFLEVSNKDDANKELNKVITPYEY